MNSDHTNGPTAKEENANLGQEMLFSYKVLSSNVNNAYAKIELQTTSEVAKNATEAELQQLYNHLKPELGKGRAFVYLKTSTPGANPWGQIARMERDGKWVVDVSIQKENVDTEPYYFLSQIDRHNPGHERMFVTLPLANAINEECVRMGWTVKRRTESRVEIEERDGLQFISVTVMPDGVDIDVQHAQGNTFVDAVQTVFRGFEFAAELKDNLYSVIGSPKYLNSGPGNPVRWTWRIGNLDATYIRFPGMDSLSITHN